MTQPLPIRYWAKVAEPAHGAACWLWLGAKSKGYGAFHVPGTANRKMLAQKNVHCPACGYEGYRLA